MQEQQDIQQQPLAEEAPAMYQPIDAPERPCIDEDDPNETFLASYTRPTSFLDNI